MNNRWLEKTLIALLAAFAFNMVASDAAHAQWVPPRGEGSLSLNYQHIRGGDHVWSELAYARKPSRKGSNADVFGTVSGDIAVMNLDYAVYDRLAVNVSLPCLR